MWYSCIVTHTQTKVKSTLSKERGLDLLSWQAGAQVVMQPVHITTNRWRSAVTICMVSCLHVKLRAFIQQTASL